MFLAHLLGHALGHTRGGQFFNGLMMLFFAAAFPVGCVLGLSAFAWKEYATECNYQRRFGTNWKANYEVEQGSLTRARIKVGVALLGMVVNTLLGVFLYRHLFPALRGIGSATRPPRRRSRRSNRSRAESRS